MHQLINGRSLAQSQTKNKKRIFCIYYFNPHACWNRFNDKKINHIRQINYSFTNFNLLENLPQKQ